MKNILSTDRCGILEYQIGYFFSRIVILRTTGNALSTMNDVRYFGGYHDTYAGVSSVL